MSVRTTLRTVARRLAPGRMADRARLYETGMRMSAGLTALAERFADAHGDRVLGGPFVGMRLAVSRIAEIDSPTARLLGVYEEEIYPALQAALDAHPARFIDLGCADGYFAAGVALAADVPVHAFDLSRSARSLTWETAVLNGVEHLLTLHRSASTVGRLPLDDTLVLCDIEGAESELFTPDLVSRLGSAHVIIELHTMDHPDVERVLAARFEATHRVDVVRAVRRDPERYPELAVLDATEDRDVAINELRFRDDGLSWLVAEPTSP